MPIHLWGTDFRRSNAEFRSRLFIAPEDRFQKLKALRFDQEGIVYLHTCNRVELYTGSEDPFHHSEDFFKSVLVHLGLKETDFYKGYHLEGKSALRHLIRVASSLESMVVGEPQILGQLKEAKSWSEQNGLCSGGKFDRAFRVAFETAKQIRTETKIGDKPVSVASLAAVKVESLEEKYPIRKVVAVGRSPMIVNTVRWLQKNHQNASVIWVNRSIEKLDEVEEAKGIPKLKLSEFLANPVSFTHLFTATSNPEVLFNRSFLEAHAKGAVVVDFAQPPDTESFEGGELIRIESLNEEAEENKVLRKGQLHRAGELVDLALRDYYLEQKETPVLREFSQIEALLVQELQQSLASIRGKISEAEFAKVELWAAKLVKRNVHTSREHLREVLRQLSGIEKRSKEEVA